MKGFTTMEKTNTEQQRRKYTKETITECTDSSFICFMRVLEYLNKQYGKSDNFNTKVKKSALISNSHIRNCVENDVVFFHKGDVEHWYDLLYKSKNKDLFKMTVDGEDYYIAIHLTEKYKLVHKTMLKYCKHFTHESGQFTMVSERDAIKLSLEVQSPTWKGFNRNKERIESLYSDNNSDSVEYSYIREYLNIRCGDVQLVFKENSETIIGKAKDKGIRVEYWKEFGIFEVYCKNSIEMEQFFTTEDLKKHISIRKRKI